MQYLIIITKLSKLYLKASLYFGSFLSIVGCIISILCMYYTFDDKFNKNKQNKIDDKIKYICNNISYSIIISFIVGLIISYVVPIYICYYIHSIYIKLKNIFNMKLTN